ncbi:hypothetical protein EYF80_059492 [Liparis tanakae]|uniref:Uncharacterized protein n=1 Tax=Liparis tanakae TaxID=230148 RepID=A0A4Z2EN86_9TELE|nr:hypothetical protein EYF80_059492 [Liparis tanakae]
MALKSPSAINEEDSEPKSKRRASKTRLITASRGRGHGEVLGGGGGGGIDGPVGTNGLVEEIQPPLKPLPFLPDQDSE